MILNYYIILSHRVVIAGARLEAVDVIMIHFI